MKGYDISFMKEGSYLCILAQIFGLQRSTHIPCPQGAFSLLCQKQTSLRVPAMVQQDWWCLCSTRTQVRQLAWHRGLRIRHCHSCGIDSNCSSNVILCLELHIPQGSQKREDQFWVPWWLIRLRTWCCHSCGLGHCCGTSLIPGPGTSTCCRLGQVKKKRKEGSSRCDEAETNLTSNHEVSGLIPGLTQWVKDLVLLWLWHRSAATAPIRLLAWEPPCAVAQPWKDERQEKETDKFINVHNGRRVHRVQ